MLLFVLFLLVYYLLNHFSAAQFFLAVDLFLCFSYFAAWGGIVFDFGSGGRPGLIIY